MKPATDQHNKDAEAPKTAVRSYHAPTLTPCGAMKDLTAAGVSVAGEAGNQGAKKHP
jgi:hypothetical protein